MGKQTATAVIKETKLLNDLVFYIISLVPALSYMFSIVELRRIVFPCKEQQPVIRGTITESCSMQQFAEGRTFTDLFMDVAAIYMYTPPPLISI